VKDIHLMRGGETDQFTVMKVPRQCPLVLLVRADCRAREVFGTKEGIHLNISRLQKWQLFSPSQILTGYF
jgi:hypothetical protein